MIVLRLLVLPVALVSLALTALLYVVGRVVTALAIGSQNLTERLAAFCGVEREVNNATVD